MPGVLGLPIFWLPTFWRSFVRPTRFRLLALLACVLVPTGWVSASTAQGDPVIAASGDIACAAGTTMDSSNCGESATASLITGVSPTAVLAVGDEQYDSGLYSEFTSTGSPASYNASWGAFNAKV
jgi:hypothetical protein